MNIAIFGASGATGTLLTQRCLAAGYKITALLRTPEKFPFRDQVHVIQGSPFDLTSVRETIEGAGVVLSALGANSLKKEDVLERAVPQIITAMQQSASQPMPVRRIIVLGSAGALPTSLDKQPAWRRWIVQNLVYSTFLKWPVASQIAQWNDSLPQRSRLDHGDAPNAHQCPRPWQIPHRRRRPASQWWPYLARRRGRLHDAADRQHSMD
jgi:hypothetical protein